MISLKSIKLKNFLSYATLNQSFLKGLYLVKGWNHDMNSANGAGKSALIDAVCFAIYGELPRKVKVDDVIKWGESSCTVDLEFSKGDVVCRIIRSRGPNSLEFYENDQKINGKDSRETQQKIIDRMGMSLTSFYQSVYFAQNSGLGEQFLFSNDEDKKEVFTELSNCGVFDVCFNEAKADVKSFVGKSVEIDVELQNLVIRKKDREELIERYRLLSSQHEQLKKAELDSGEEKLKELKRKVSAAEKSFAEDLKLIKAIDDYSAMLEILTTELNENAEKEYYASVTEKQLDQKDLEVTAKERNRVWTLLQESKCPTCGGDIDKTKFCTDLASLDEQQSKSSQKIEGMDITIESLKKKMDKEKQKQKDISDLNVKIAVAQKRVEESKRLYENQKLDLEKQMHEVHASIEAISTKKNDYLELIETASAEIKTMDEEVTGKKNKLQEIQKYLGAYEILIKAFSREGIKAFVFAQMVNELNLYIDEYMRQLFEDAVTLRFDVQSVTGSGQIKQKIDTQLKVSGISRNINLLSGGEIARLILATNFAISKVISSRSTSVSFSFLDECFTGLDHNGKAQIMSFLKNLSAGKDFVYVIDHQTEFQNLFDGVFMAEKKNGVSTLQGE